MSSPTRIVIIVLAIALLGGIAYVGYLYFSKTTPLTPEETANESTSTPSENIKTSSFSQQSQSSALGFWIYKNAVYYVNSDGQVVRGGENETVVSSATISSVNSVVAPENGEFAIVSFSGVQNPQYSVFAASSSSWRPLPVDTVAVSLSPSGKELAYLEETKGITSIVMSAPDLKRPRKVGSLHLVDSNMIWGADNSILLFEKPSASLLSNLWEFNPKTASIKKIASGNGMALSVSPYGGLRFSVVGNQRRLELTTADGKTVVRQLPFITLPEKCAFDAKNLYCAVPESIPAGIVLPDDYLKQKFLSVDTIYKYSLSTRSSEELFISTEKEAIDASRLSVSGKSLYFINRYDGIVYSFEL